MAQDFVIFPSMNFVDLGLYQFGREDCSPAHSFGPAIRNHYLFHYILRGRGKLMWQDAKGHEHGAQLRAGQGFLISPGQITTYVADDRNPWEYCWLEFDGLRAKESLEITGLSVNHPVYDPVHHEFEEKMRDEMLYIVRNKKEAPLHIIGHLYLFIDALIRSVRDYKPSAGKMKDYYIKEALAFIEHNYMNDISVEDMAESLSLNRSYFGKIFKEAVGKSPQEFLICYRMIKAAELLKLTHYSINEIGYAVGYPNQLHFSRAFKNVYGASPRKWRNANSIQDLSLSREQEDAPSE
ncbi:MAG TPA: AraC family transcriptional regulator [Lachnospiraceae bacterium]|nr:AraC family transcriptional regulator [Lachnospiraceae bacterium]